MNGSEPRWWASLNHGGLLIAPSAIAKYFGTEPEPLPTAESERLREAVVRAQVLDSLSGFSKRDEAFSNLLTVVLENVCGFAHNNWLRGNDVPAQWSRRAVTGEVIKPRRVWQGPLNAVLPVFVEHEPRLGIGRGRRSVARVVEWLRAGTERVALVTNHRQFRLVHAGSDYEAWAEWDVPLWFEEGRPGLQVDALRQLLSPAALIPSAAGERSRLLAAIDDSRKGQVELSAALGERVRRAVELLIQSHAARLKSLDADVTPRHIYIAATRVVMRMVVVLFAEARELLPRSLPAYEDSYGLQGLRTTLERIASGTGNQSLSHRRAAWPRILALFRLIHEGSHHADLPVQRYGGQLFARGDATSADPIDRALAVFESIDLESSPTDAAVVEMLGCLCRTTARVLQGRSSQRILVPVDFSNLSSEYIGILYEGLLDYELRRAPDGDPMVFLNVGDQPVLSLSRLESMDDGQLKKMFEKLATTKKTLAVNESEDGSEEEEHGEEDEIESDIVDEESVDEEPEPDTVEDEAVTREEIDEQLRQRVHDWAKRAVLAAGIVKRPRGRRVQAGDAFSKEVDVAAAALWERVVLPGEWYLVVWGGTRKGSGTFYTRPQLAVPTVRRTLEPLVLEHGQPRAPEALLAIKVCDPAMGSGSFLSATLRHLTDLLWQSLLHHGWLTTHDDRITMPPDDGRRPAWFLECVKNFPLTTDDPELPIRARLKRVVVERSIYGVDLDPLAVELARLALWVETMDRDLPFEFLDHRLKVGNALVGCWVDRFEDYPIMAWDREGGDKAHGTFINHYRVKRDGKLAGDKWTQAIKDARDGGVKRDLVDSINQQGHLFGPQVDLHPETVHDAARALLTEMEALPVHETDARAAFYRDRLAKNAEFVALREAFDTWCAIWFWPADQLTSAPTAKTLLTPSDEARQIVRRLSAEHRFFHWELEFPDVFASRESGFDAIVGNPPWDIQKPNSKEFFSNVDPLYRAYGKQEALQKQREYFTAHVQHELDWIRYSARFKALSNWTKHVWAPFGDPGEGGESLNLGSGNVSLHERWRATRARHDSYADAAHPFRYQGSADINTYKLFLEQAHALLRSGGQLGFIVPSGVYTDKGSTTLREMFLHQCDWQWLFVFENRQQIFDIHRSFKFGPLIVRKGGVTNAFRAAFMRHDVNDWENAEQLAVPYPRTQVERFSPRTAAVLEIRNRRDLEVLEKIYANSVLLGDKGPDGWGIEYAREFDMTNDSKLFPPRPVWEAKGYQPDEYGRWIKFKEKRPVEEHLAEVGWIHLADGSGVVHEEAIEDIALLLYQGIMIQAFEPAARGWASGTGLTARWDHFDPGTGPFRPQYLMRSAVAREHSPSSAFFRVGFRDIARSTDQRTMICAVLPPFPAGNKVPTLSCPKPEALAFALNSYVFDWSLRTRLGAASLNYYVLAEAPIPALRDDVIALQLTRLVLALNATRPIYAPLWINFGDRTKSQSAQSATSPAERLRVRVVLDVCALLLAGLEPPDVSWVLRDCDWAIDDLRRSSFRKQLDPKGFWREDAHRSPELRRSILTAVAHRDAYDNRQSGVPLLHSFLNMNAGAGWKLPETVVLADYGFTNDDRCKRPQAVSTALERDGGCLRMLDSVEESWRFWERHAKNVGQTKFSTLPANSGK